MTAYDWEQTPTVLQTIERLQHKSINAVSLLEEVWARLDAHADDAIFITKTKERAQREAEASDIRRNDGGVLGPLDGVPIAWKDLFDTKGYRTTAGAKLRLDSPIADRDANAVQACFDQGMVCVGKTNLSEFAYSGLGLNPHFGTPRNPAQGAQHRIPGGSSSGSAAAVAAGLVPVAVGTDTAGSVRVPASYCGLIGYKASQGRYSTEGVFPLSESLDSLGIFAHTVEDVMIVDACMRGQSPLLGGKTKTVVSNLSDVRIIIPQSVVFNDVNADIISCFDAVVERLRDCGAHITAMPFAPFEETVALFQRHGTLAVAEAATLHAELLASPKASMMDPNIRSRMMTASNHSAQDYIRLQWERARLQTVTKTMLQDQFLLFPTTPMTAPALAPLEASDEVFAATNLKALRNTLLGNYLSTPGVNLPIGFDGNNMPIGALLSAASDKDDRLLNAADRIQSALAST